MSFADYLTKYFPNLQHDIKVAHIHKTPREYLHNVLKKTFMFGILLTILLFMLVHRMGWSWSVLLIGAFVIFSSGFWFGMQQTKIVAGRRAVDIDREVLFAGRFLLIKLHSGQPLVNALIEAANSYGVASRYFAEIVEDIELGTTLEEAIENAMTYTSSDSFRKILFQIHNALRLGIDVTQSLESVLEEITEDQLLAIERYGKKLSSVTLFYMLLGVVFPSLGMTIMTVLISFTNITLSLTMFMVIVFFVAVINFLFITVFKGIRPKVNI